MAITGYKFAKINGGATDALDSQDGDTLYDGDFAFVLTNDKFYPYLLDEDSGETESSPDIIAPDTNPGDKRWKLQRLPSDNSLPVGCVVAWLGGYFTNGTNDDYQEVLAGSISEINDYVDGDGFRVCDGAEYNNATSPIFNGSGRHLPNLTDNRFIMGDNYCGGGRNGSGGDTSHNAINHNHIINHHHNVDIGQFNSGSTTLSISQMPSHHHSVQHAEINTVSTDNAHKNVYCWDGPGYDTSDEGGGNAHNHKVNPPSTTTGGSSAGNTGTTQHDNRPKWLGCVYIMKVI
jgi:microcystin-dependent protein